MKITKGIIPCAKKVVIYGPEGIGKSTFASQFPDPVFIDTEGSTNSMDVARLPKPTSWQMLLEEIQYVKDHPDVCKTLVIDTVDWAESMCIQSICDKHQKSGIEDFGYGNGYVYTKEEMGRFLNQLSEVVEVGVNVVLTAHAQIRKFEQPDELGAYDRWELKLGKKTSSQTSPLIKEWADMLLFANYKTFSIAVDDKGQKRKAQGGERVLYTSHHACWDAKNRYGLEGILRKGHKMLIAGPSKAGKSFLQIELCIAIAEGKKWLQWYCAQGRVMYVNLELDRASCLHRFKDVYTSMGIAPENLQNIDIWNLRGKSVPMDKLAPKLIRRAAKKDYVAIIIDPIYKVITGDENSADQMANFCNQFDKVCTELGCAVIYCHHHSKGSQGGKKSMDRASGSGVFARDPDALLDLIELEPTEALMKQEENKAICGACKSFLDAHFKWQDDLSQDDLLSSTQMLDYCRGHLDKWQMIALERQIEEAKK